MNDPKIRSPYDILCDALDIPREQIDENAAIGSTPKWDSLNHLHVITGLEKSYNIAIPDEDIEKYTTMQAILELHKKVSEG